jgi:hypothetical protein
VKILLKKLSLTLVGKGIVSYIFYFTVWLMGYVFALLLSVLGMRRVVVMWLESVRAGEEVDKMNEFGPHG